MTLTRHYQGLPVSEGLAAGQLYQVRRSRRTGGTPASGPRAGATPEHVRDAFAAVARERSELAAQLRESGRADQAEIVTIGALIAADPALVEPAIAGTAAGADARAAVRNAAEAQAAALAALANADLAARADDVRQVATAVLAHLAGDSAPPPPATGFILVQREVDPADMIRFAEAGLVGAVSVSGSASSHAAIIARGLGLPMLAGADPAVLVAPAGHPAILDAEGGRLIVDPAPEELAAIGGPGAPEAAGAAEATRAAGNTWAAGITPPTQTAGAAQATPTARTAPAAAATQAATSPPAANTQPAQAADTAQSPGATPATAAAGATGTSGVAGAGWRDGGSAGLDPAVTPRTAAGEEVTLLCNVASAPETRLGLARGAAGVGLLRTEIPFTKATGWPTEAEHAAALDPVLGLLAGRPAVVRLLDFSGDKVPPFLAGGQAEPPRPGGPGRVAGASARPGRSAPRGAADRPGHPASRHGADGDQPGRAGPGEGQPRGRRRGGRQRNA